MLTSDKHSNLLGQLLSYKENELLWIRTHEPSKVAQLSHLRIGPTK
jgi:hypothetical protein